MDLSKFENLTVTDKTVSESTTLKNEIVAHFNSPRLGYGIVGKFIKEIGVRDVQEIFLLTKQLEPQFQPGFFVNSCSASMKKIVACHYEEKTH